MLAWVALASGALRVGHGLYAWFNLDTPGFDIARYVGSTTPGHLIDQGVMAIMVAAALGILAEISRALHRAD